MILHFKQGCCYGRNNFIEVRVGNVDAADDSTANPRVAATGFARVKRTTDYKVRRSGIKLIRDLSSIKYKFNLRLTRCNPIELHFEDLLMSR